MKEYSKNQFNKTRCAKHVAFALALSTLPVSMAWADCLITTQTTVEEMNQLSSGGCIDVTVFNDVGAGLTGVDAMAVNYGGTDSVTLGAVEIKATIDHHGTTYADFPSDGGNVYGLVNGDIGVITLNGATVTAKGGDSLVENPKDGIYNAAYGIVNASSGIINLNEGFVTATGGMTSTQIDGPTTVNDVYGIMNVSSGTVNVNGTQITATGGINANSYSLGIGGSGYGINNQASGTINVKDATISASGGGDSGSGAGYGYGIYNAALGTANLNNVTINATGGSGYGLYNEASGTANLSNVTISTTGSSGDAVAIHNDGILNITGPVTITSGDVNLGASSTVNVTLDKANVSSHTPLLDTSGSTGVGSKESNFNINGTLNVVVPNLSDVLAISNLDGYDLIVASSTSTVMGTFSAITINGSLVPDYLKKIIISDKYLVTAVDGLSWDDASDNAGGTFTLLNKGDHFNVDGPLTDKTPTLTWDGKSLIKKGEGTLTLSGQLSYTGPTLIEEGTLTLDGSTGGGQLTGEIIGIKNDPKIKAMLQLINGGILTGRIDPVDVTIDNASTWNVTADSEVGTLTNSGTIAFVNTQPYKTITVDGDFVGGSAGIGTLVMNTVLGGDDSATDKLVVMGDTSGATYVKVNNVGGAGATTVKGIQLIEVHGASNGTFNLVSPTGAPTQYVSAGAYDYQLLKDSAGWVLSSGPDSGSMIRPEVAAYLGNQYGASTLFRQNLDDRFSSSVSSRQGYNSWGRITGAHSNNDVAGGQLSQDSNSYVMQVGSDLLIQDFGDSSLHLGLMGGIGNAKSQSTGNDHDVSATGHVMGYSAGVYGTWTHQSGFYVDSWLQYGWYQNKVSRPDLNDLEYNSHNVMASLEAGYTIPLYQNKNSQWFVVPEAQVIYDNYHQDSIRDSYNTEINVVDANNATTRLGARFYGQWFNEAKMRIEPSLVLNWWHGKESGIQMDNDVMEQGVPMDRFEAKVGMNIQLSQVWQMNVNVGAQMGQNSYKSYMGQVEAQYKF